MAHYSAKPLQVLLLPSIRLLSVLVVASLSVVVIILLMPINIWLKLLAISVVLVCSVYSIWRDALLRLPGSWAAIKINSEGEISLTRLDGSNHQAIVQASSVVMSNLIILNLKLESQTWPAHLILLPDSADLASQRKLRVWLRWGMLEQDENQEGV